MAIAKTTLIGMINFFELDNEDLFKNMTIPAAVDKETLIASIVMRGGEFPVFWANPYFVQKMIGLWSNKMRPTFVRWVKTMKIDYNPLYNYDRYEEYTDKEKSVGTANGTVTKKVTGYDSDVLRTNDQNVSDNTGENNRDFEHKAHLFGNIGVTTSQQMAEAEYQLAQNYNIYDMIAEQFVTEFCVGVY